jgi:hypothetical protein
MATTPHLGIGLVAAAQAQKHVTANEAFAVLDGLVQAAVLDRDRADPPADPADGDRYIVAAGATGAWAGHVGAIAHFTGGAWAFRAPAAGWRVFVADEAGEVVFDGAGWVETPAGRSPTGAACTLAVLEEELTLSGASVTSTIAIPNGAIVFAVSSRTTAAITGATSYGVGIAGETTKFGNFLGVAEGSTNFGSIGPQAFYADTPIVVTANGGDFTGGRVRVAIHHLAIRPPQS